MAIASDDPIHSLSPREAVIPRGLIAGGAANKVIARELDIAETTVKIHVQHILRWNRATCVHAAVYATERGWT